MLFKRPVTQDELRYRYPAIFAEAPKETTSDQYLYIPTYKLIDGLTRQGFEIIGAKQQRSRTNTKDHAKHVVYLSHQGYGQNQLAKVGEEIPMLALTNSHNGLSSFAIDTAFYRLVCSNGLMLPSSSLSSARIVHKKGMEQDVIEAAVKVVTSFPEQIKQIEAMKSVQLTSAEQNLLAASASRLVFEPEVIEVNKKAGINVEEKLLRVRRSADQGTDLWRSFNVIQENVIKGGIKLVRENEQGHRSLAKTRGVNSIDRDAKLNKELFTLAQEMLKIKTGAVA